MGICQIFWILTIWSIPRHSLGQSSYRLVSSNIGTRNIWRRQCLGHGTLNISTGNILRQYLVHVSSNIGTGNIWRQYMGHGNSNIGNGNIWRRQYLGQSTSKLLPCWLSWLDDIHRTVAINRSVRTFWEIFSSINSASGRCDGWTVCGQEG